MKSQLNLNIYFSWSVHVLDQAYNPLWWPLAVNLQFWCCLQPIFLSDRTSSVSGRNAIRISIVSWLMALMSNECCFPRSIARLSIVLLIMTTKCIVMWWSLSSSSPITTGIVSWTISVLFQCLDVSGHLLNSDSYFIIRTLRLWSHHFCCSCFNITL